MNNLLQVDVEDKTITVKKTSPATVPVKYVGPASTAQVKELVKRSGYCKQVIHLTIDNCL